MLETYGDIAFSSRTGAIYSTLKLEDYGYGEPVKPADTPVLTTDFSNSQWYPWGVNNIMPLEIADDLENCGVLAAAMDAKARIGTGKGIQPFMLRNITSDGKEELEWVKDNELHDWLELNEGFEFAYDSSFDKHAYGWNCGSYILNGGRTRIQRVKRHDVYKARLGRREALGGLIKDLYLSDDWTKAGTTYETTKQLRLSLLEEGNELADLHERVAANSSNLQYAFFNRSRRNGREYYPVPVYRSNRAWVKIARSVPAFKIAMFRNSINVLQQVTIHPKFWEDKFGQNKWNHYTPEEKDTLKNEWHKKVDGWLAGEDNAYKSLFTGGYTDPVSGKFQKYIEVEEVKNTPPDGQFLPDSGAANSEMLFALMINPAMMGAGNPGGKAYGDTSGGSNVRESFLVQIMTMEAERQLNTTVFNVVKHFNGWAKRLQGENMEKGRLVFRYPSGLLTTLDTGKSTKPENL